MFATRWRRPKHTALLEEFARIQSIEVIVPTTSGQAVRLRCVVRPGKAQSILLQRVGLILPERLRILKGVAQM